MALNKVILQGRLAADPQLKARQDGTNMTSFCPACERNCKDEEGKKETCFFGVSAYNFQGKVKGGGVIWVNCLI